MGNVKNYLCSLWVKCVFNVRENTQKPRVHFKACTPNLPTFVHFGSSNPQTNCGISVRGSQNFTLTDLTDLTLNK